MDKCNILIRLAYLLDIRGTTDIASYVNHQLRRKNSDFQAELDDHRYGSMLRHHIYGKKLSMYVDVYDTKRMIIMYEYCVFKNTRILFISDGASFIVDESLPHTVYAEVGNHCIFGGLVNIRNGAMPPNVILRDIRRTWPRPLSLLIQNTDSYSINIEFQVDKLSIITRNGTLIMLHRMWTIYCDDHYIAIIYQRCRRHSIINTERIMLYGY